ncbi:PfaD family polyunsaturated fatty acid/polyketide biosynthesis protein [Streptomyces sp. MAR4 CNY-716]
MGHTWNPEARPVIDPTDLGSAPFRRDHGVRYAYVAGSMYMACSSEEMVLRMGRAGLLGYFGTGGLRDERVVSAIERFRRELGDGPYGLNLLPRWESPQKEAQTVELFLRHGVRRVEASAFVRPSVSLVRYRVTGLRRGEDGAVRVANRVMAKVSRPEVIERFLSPPPDDLVAQLLDAGQITAEEAELARRVPMADDLCAEADSGGHTDQRPLVILLPDTIRRRDAAMRRYGYAEPVRVGAAGGLGVPESVAGAFLMGADFVLTGSINQCTAEAGVSDQVRDMLQRASVHDMMIVPAGDMLEAGTRAQVLRRGLFYPARANRLYELYRQYDSLEDLDERTATELQTKYFRRSFDEVWEETRRYYERANPQALQRAEVDPKQKMALIFKAYFVQAKRLAIAGSPDHQVDYQINSGPAIGALNGYLKGTPWEDWRNRHADELAAMLMRKAATYLTDRFHQMTGGGQPADDGPPAPVPTPLGVEVP